MSFLKKLRDAAKQFEAPPPDPWRKVIEPFVRDVDAVSTSGLLDLVGARHTTQNARHIAAIMRDLKFIAIQSRRLTPGGFRDTVSRGWARPMRPLSDREKVKPAKVPPSPPNLGTMGQGEKVKET